MIALTTAFVAQSAPTGGGGSLGIILIIGVAALVGLRRFTDIRPVRAVAARIPSVQPTTLLLGAVALGLAVLLSGGNIATRVPLVVGLILLGTYAILRRLGEYHALTFALLAAVEVVIALSALGEPVLGAVFNSESAPIVVLVVGALAWRVLSIYQSDDPAPEQRVVEVVRREQ